MKDNFIWLNEAVPVLDNQILPVIGPAAILADICMEEMGIRNEPGGIVQAKVTLRYGLLLKK